MTEKTDPQPLTDEELRAWEKILIQFGDVDDELYGTKAIARIRADGRRIRELEQVSKLIIETTLKSGRTTMDTAELIPLRDLLELKR